MTSYTLRVLADHLNADVQGDDSVEISTVGTLDGAGKGQISFLANSKYRSQLETTAASAILMSPADAEGFKGNAIVLKDRPQSRRYLSFPVPHPSPLDSFFPSHKKLTCPKVL